MGHKKQVVIAFSSFLLWFLKQKKKKKVEQKEWKMRRCRKCEENLQLHKWALNLK